MKIKKHQNANTDTLDLPLYVGRAREGDGEAIQYAYFVLHIRNYQPVDCSCENGELVIDLPEKQFIDLDTNWFMEEIGKGSHVFDVISNIKLRAIRGGKVVEEYSFSVKK